MWIKRMSYERIWAGPGLGMATHSEIAFESAENKPLLYVSYEDGPMGVRYDVTTKSIQDVMTGNDNNVLPLVDSDFLESYTTFTATQRHSKYRFVFSELENYTQRMLGINEAMKAYEADQPEPVEPFKVKLFDEAYQFYGPEGGNFGEDENLKASYVNINGVTVCLCYRHDTDGGECWSCYNDETGETSEVETFEETQRAESEDGEGFRALWNLLEKNRKKRLGRKYSKRPVPEITSPCSGLSAHESLKEATYQALAKPKSGVVEKAHAVCTVLGCGPVTLDFRHYKDGHEVWSVKKGRGRTRVYATFGEAMGQDGDTILAMMEFGRFIEQERRKGVPSGNPPKKRRASGGRCPGMPCFVG